MVGREKRVKYGKRHRVVDHIVGYLAASGVDYIFGVDGANIEDVYDAAFFRDDITAVLAKHEFSAATMADGYGRSGAGLGVVAATSGGGCLNTVPGLDEAFASRVPVLALIGAIAAVRTGGPAVLLLSKDIQHPRSDPTGCGLSDRSPILDVEWRTFGQYSGDMTIAVDPPRKFWEPGPGELHVGFTESKITKVLARGNRQVPEVAYPAAHLLEGLRAGRAADRLRLLRSGSGPPAVDHATAVRHRYRQPGGGGGLI